MAASVSSSTSLVRKWRTAFLTLRDETLTSPPTSTVLHHIIFYQLDTLIAASSHLPPHEVLTDTKFLMELGGTISIWEEGDADTVHIFSQLSHLIHNVSRHVSFEVTSSSWALVLDCYGKLLEMFFGKACTKRIFLGNVNVVRTLEQFLETLRCVTTVYQRTSSLSENTLLLNFLLSIASRFQTELIDSSHTSVSWMRGSESGNRASGSYSSWEVQTNAFTMISEVYLRVGTYLPVEHWQSTVEVFRKVMDVLAAKGLLLEDNVLAKFYTSLLHCLHLVLIDPKGSLSDHDPPEDAVVTSCGHVFCNQCICEHLTGDDNQCPTTNCKARLSVSSIFSRAALRSSLSEGQESVADCSGSELAETLQPCSSGGSFDSSKIKAVIEVLHSLSRPRYFTSTTSSLITVDGGDHCPKNLSDPFSEGLPRDVNNNQSLVLDSDSNSPVPAVGEKAIVFSQWTRMLDLLESCLKDSSIKYRRLDGTMSIIARDKAVKDFNTQPEVSVIIMSLKAASLGLNMVAACHVILLDLWWNPTTEDQAIDRAHRIGQTRPVSVLRLTVKDTVEDRILALQQKKREMVASAFGEDETGSRQTRLTVEDLEYLFMHN